MFNQPTTNYLLDELCSIAIGQKVLVINLHNGLFDLKTVDRLLAILDTYTQGKKYLTVINCDQSARTTIASLKRMAQPRAMEYAIAKAYVIQSIHQKIMANIFVFVFRPKVPVKFFSSEEKAKVWLDNLFFV